MLKEIESNPHKCSWDWSYAHVAWSYTKQL